MSTTTEHAASSTGTTENLNAVVHLLSEAETAMETFHASSSERLVALDREIADADALLALLSKLADMVPVAKAGEEFHSALVAVSEVAAQRVTALSAAKEAEVAWQNHLVVVDERIVVARQIGEDFVAETREVRPTDDNAFQTAGR